MKKYIIIIGLLSVALCFAAPSIKINAGSVRTSNESYVTVTAGSVINASNGAPFYAVHTKPCASATTFKGPEGNLDALTINPSGDMGNVTVTVYSGSYHPNTATSVLHWWDVNTTNLQSCSITFRFRNGYLGSLTLADLAVYEYSLSWVKLSETITSSNVGASFTDVTFSGINFANAKGSHPLILADKNDATLPVVLSYFNATALYNGNVRLEWISQSESEMLGYYVWRADSAELDAAEIVSPLVEASNTSNQVVYSFTDADISGSGTWNYWLQSLNMDGSNHFYGSIAVTVAEPDNPAPPVPLETRLNKPYPNPFNPDLTISYSLKQASPVNLTVLNLRGQVVQTIPLGNKQPGNFTHHWDGRDAQGSYCASGLYFIRMQTSTDSFIQKAMLLK